MKVQQRRRGHGQVVIAFFLDCQVPGVIRGYSSGAANMVGVVPIDLGLEKGIGCWIVCNLLISQKCYHALLKSLKSPLDFSFCLSVWSNAVSHANGCKSALELGMGIQAVSRGCVSKESQPIGVERRRRAVGFDGRTEMRKVRPCGIAGHKAPGDDFAGMIINGQNEGLILVSGPPRVR